MLGFLERKGQQVFERYGFSAEGESQAGCPAVRQAKDYQPQVLQTGRVASALEAVCQDMRQRGLAEAVVAEVERQAPAAVYESAADTVTIHIDEAGSSLCQVLGFVVGFLVSTDLVARRWLFFTDVQRSLQNAIAGFFAWHGAASLLRDWYHVVKKFREELSLACTGREIRNRHGQALLRLLWFGLLLPASELKSHKPIERLIGYLERNRNAMSC